MGIFKTKVAPLENAHTQIQILAQAKEKTRWMAIPSGGIKKIGAFRALVEWIKKFKLGQKILGESKTTPEKLSNSLISILKKGKEKGEFKTDDFNLILLAVKHVGLIAKGKSTCASLIAKGKSTCANSDLNDVIKDVVEDVFKRLYKGAKPTEETAKSFYSDYKTSLEPFLTEDKLLKFSFITPVIKQANAYIQTVKTDEPKQPITQKKFTDQETATDKELRRENKDAETEAIELKVVKLDFGTQVETSEMVASETVEVAPNPIPAPQISPNLKPQDAPLSPNLKPQDARMQNNQTDGEAQTDEVYITTAPKPSFDKGEQTAENVTKIETATAETSMELPSLIDGTTETNRVETSESQTETKDVLNHDAGTETPVKNFASTETSMELPSLIDGTTETNRVETSESQTETKNVLYQDAGTGTPVKKFASTGTSTDDLSSKVEKSILTDYFDGSLPKPEPKPETVTQGTAPKTPTGSDSPPWDPLSPSSWAGYLLPERITTLLQGINPADERKKREANISAVMEFGNHDTAQIKAFGAGTLAQADGLWWGYSYLFGTQLDRTVPLLEETWDDVTSDFDEAKNNLVKQSIEGFERFTNSFVTLMKTKQGLERIAYRYNEKYKNEPSHAGLVELNKLKDAVTAKFIDSENQYRDAVREEGMRLNLSDEVLNALTHVKHSPGDVEQAVKDLGAYQNEFSKNLTIIQINDLINDGAKLIKAIMAGDIKEASKDEKTCQYQLAAITWKLMGLAIASQNGFREGTFVIEDKNSRLFNFIRSAGSYERVSSHYKGRNKDKNAAEKKHYGVDVKNNRMPSLKRTILFAEIPGYNTNGTDEKFLFFKPENYGLKDPLDIFMHAVEYVESVHVKISGTGGDDGPDMRKERVPVNTERAFKEIIGYLDSIKLKIDGYDLKNAAKEGKVWGIAYMYHFVSAVKKLPEAQNKSLKDLMDGFDQSIFGYDHLDKRTGREVYITKDALAAII